MDLLKEAEKRFAVGTVFKNTNFGYTCTSIKVKKGSTFFELGEEILVRIPRTGSYTVYCCKRKEWAIITSKTKQNLFMKSGDIKKTSISFGAFSTVGVILLIAKLVGLLDYSWWIVFLPFYIIPLIFLTGGIVIQLLLWLLDLIDYLERLWRKRKLKK